jgi:hypothetical protein
MAHDSTVKKTNLPYKLETTKILRGGIENLYCAYFRAARL